MTESRPRPWRSRLLAALGALLALVAIEGVYRAIRAGAGVWDGARFVWAEDARGGAARAFYLARDFRVPAGTSFSDAYLAAMGDEEAQIHLNGAWVGGGRYTLGEPADRYDVSELLRTGNNRLVVEARSATGVGGVLVALFLDERSPPLVVTDESWRVFGRHVDGLVEGTLPLSDGVAPRVLGRPPLGRWRSPPLGPVRDPAPLLARDAWAARLAEVPTSPAPGVDGATEVWAVDFGEVVEGTLELWSDLGSCGCPLRFFSSAEERDAFYDRAAADAGEVTSRTLVLVPGAPRWRDVEPRRFRYVTIEAPRPPSAARVLFDAAVVVAAPSTAGPFGLPPPRG